MTDYKTFLNAYKAAVQVGSEVGADIKKLSNNVSREITDIEINNIRQSINDIDRIN